MCPDGNCSFFFVCLFAFFLRLNRCILHALQFLICNHLIYLNRAVVWTDFIQFILMLAAIIAVIVLGVDEAGGFSNVWTAAERGQRLIVFK